MPRAEQSPISDFALRALHSGSPHFHSGQSAEVYLFLRLIVAKTFVLIREPPAPIGQTGP